jgi:hypothetical protein
VAAFDFHKNYPANPNAMLIYLLEKELLLSGK